jgi:hypothetical protein
MADNHPYVPAPGTIVPVINHLRRSFPLKITADTLKKLGFAPKNESYVINVLRYLDLLDQDSKKTETASKVFTVHDDTAFAEAFDEVVKTAYSDLFELHGDNAWALDTESLITFFRQSDQTSAIVGKRQAASFQILAAFSGHGEVPQVKVVAPKKAKSREEKPSKTKEQRKAMPSASTFQKTTTIEGKSPIGLTVRIEINLPSDGDQETYDRIFKSIRENLLYG